MFKSGNTAENNPTLQSAVQTGQTDTHITHLPLHQTVLRHVLSGQCLPCDTQCVNIVGQHPANNHTV